MPAPDAETSLLRLTLELMAEGVLAFNFRDRSVIHNQRVVDLLKLSPAMLTTDAVEERKAHLANLTRDPAGFLAILKSPEYLQQASYYLMELEDGRYLERYTKPWRDAEGLVGVMWVFRDITALKNAELALKVEREKTESLLRNVLPASVIDRLKESPAGLAEHFPEATILFADIVGFTPNSAGIDPDQLVRFLNEVFSVFDTLSGLYGLEKIKTIGDAYMVAAGVPVPHEKHVQAIADFALEALASVGSVKFPDGSPVRLRIGIHTGNVVAGVIGLKKFIYDLWGDTVNVASRMESHGAPGRIHVSAQVAAVLGDAYLLEDRGVIEVKGRGQMHTFFLDGRRPLA